MRKIKVDKKIILISVLGLILLIELIVIPLEIGSIFNINKRITKTNRDLNIIQKEWPDKEDYLKRSKDLEQEIGQMRAKFILPQQETTLFSYISSESKNFNVQIKLLKPALPQDYASNKLGKFKYLPIIIEAKSSSYDLLNFFNFIQTGQYFFDVTEMRISSDSPYHSVTMVICGLLKEN